MTTAASDTYTYDATGNMLTGGGRTVTYNTFRKPLTLSKGTHTSTFTYGPDRSHYKRVDADGTTVKTTLSIGNVEFITHSSGVTETKRYIGDILVVTDSSTAGHSEHYTHKDTLGSTDIITDAVGGIVAEMSFDAFGKRRNVLTLAELAEAQYDVLNAITTKGFTGHEMVDEVGIIHMGGRIYDPELGRFLSVDPNVQEALNTQNLNRYSYALNSPLAYTDPTGFNFVSSLTSYSTDEYGITITQTATIWYAPVFMGEGVDLSWFEVRREYSYHVSLPNGVEVSGVSTAAIGFDVVYAAYDAASAIVNRHEDYILNLYTPTIDPKSGEWNLIDAGEDPWMPYALIMAGITNGREANRSAVDEYLYEVFSDWFSVLLASNVADSEFVENSGCIGDQCLVKGYDEEWHMTGNYRIDWREIHWDDAIPIDPVIEFFTKKNIPETGVRFGTQFGYPEYEFEQTLIEYQSEIVDGVVVNKHYTGRIISTGVTEYRNTLLDQTIHTRPRRELCFFGSCTL